MVCHLHRVAPTLATVLEVAHGFAPAVVVAQAVRLTANLVREAEQRRLGDTPDDKATTEVRALQLGLSSVPRVDPRVPRSLDEYCSIYREWLLLLRGRLQQQSLELPPEVFDESNHELMRYALCYSVLQARSLKEALIAMDKTLANVRDFVAWWPKHQFLGASDLEAWSRITWWEGPDAEGRLWLMIDNRAAINASRTHGTDVVARAVVSNRGPNRL
ncbi:MAG: hypothetical protein J3K34DRAFT_293498 [Monoraphidium minutum]|nr:MAG: hypothetical protein J3K34DRAFT_293498 [Monoraphidium minutum]